MKNKGIPRDVLSELNINESEPEISKATVTAIVERHQVKLPIPSKIRREIDFLKGQKLNVEYDPKKRTLTYALQND